jgi:hypothetical protein
VKDAQHRLKKAAAKNAKAQLKKDSAKNAESEPTQAD